MANQGNVVIKVYKGQHDGATQAFQADAARMAYQSYYPTTQVWAPGAYGCGNFIVALLLCLVLIGIIIFIYMLIVKPAGTLTVTYELRSATVDENNPSPQTHVRCPECQEWVLKGAKICKHCHTKLAPIVEEQISSAEWTVARPLPDYKKPVDTSSISHSLGRFFGIAGPKKSISWIKIILLMVFIWFLASVFIPSKSNKDTEKASVQEVKITEPPNGFRNIKWGDSPTKNMKKHMDTTDDGLDLYEPIKGTKLQPLFDIPVAEEAYSYSKKRFYSGNAWFDGKDNFERVKNALFKEYGKPTFSNEKEYIWDWNWPNTKIKVHLDYQTKFSRTTVTYTNDAIQ